VLPTGIRAAAPLMMATLAAATTVALEKLMMLTFFSTSSAVKCRLHLFTFVGMEVGVNKHAQGHWCIEPSVNSA